MSHQVFIPYRTEILDSIAKADSAAVGEELIPIVVTQPAEGLDAPPRKDGQTAASWLLFAVLIVVGIVGARYKSNLKYVKMMFHDLTSTRERENLFDDTAKETSFMFTLNVLCAVTTGLMLFAGLSSAGLLQSSAVTFSADAWICIAIVGVYCAVMPGVYWVVGNVFSDTLHTRMWLRGFMASQALLGLIALVPALAALFYPVATNALTITALCVLIILKLIFISKSFRIFFTDFSSWMLFLYYLCTLEILPLVLICSAAVYFIA